MNYRGALIATAVALMGKGRPIALLPIKLQKELAGQQVPLTEVQAAFDQDMLNNFARAALFSSEDQLQDFGLATNQLDVALLLRELADIETTPLTEQEEGNADG